jgi:hypothetical protein
MHGKRGNVNMDTLSYGMCEEELVVVLRTRSHRGVCRVASSCRYVSRSSDVKGDRDRALLRGGG